MESIFLNRRSFILGLIALGFTACTKHRYIRPAGRLELGKVRELLYTSIHVRSKATMVFRDAEGWKALSARCTYNGCDLTHQFQTQTFFCPCCKSEFDINGKPISGVASVPLPWMTMSYQDGYLYAEPEKIVDAKYRFTTPEIEQAIREAQIPIKELSVEDEVKIPEILQGKGDGNNGEMFTDDNPEILDEIDKIK